MDIATWPISHDEESLLCWQWFRRSEAGTSEAGEAIFLWELIGWSLKFQHMFEPLSTLGFLQEVSPQLACWSPFGDWRHEKPDPAENGQRRIEDSHKSPAVAAFLEHYQAFGFRSSRFRDIYWCNFVDVLSLAYFKWNSLVVVQYQVRKT